MYYYKLNPKLNMFEQHLFLKPINVIRILFGVYPDALCSKSRPALIFTNTGYHVEVSRVYVIQYIISKKTFIYFIF